MDNDQKCSSGGAGPTPPVRLTDIDQVPVLEPERRGDDVVGDRSPPPDGGSPDTDSDKEDGRSGEEAPEATRPERDQSDAARPANLTNDQGADQEPGEDKEQIYADEAASQKLHTSDGDAEVVRHDGDHCKPAEAVERADPPRRY